MILFITGMEETVSMHVIYSWEEKKFRSVHSACSTGRDFRFGFFGFRQRQPPVCWSPVILQQTQDENIFAGNFIYVIIASPNLCQLFWQRSAIIMRINTVIQTARRLEIYFNKMQFELRTVPSNHQINCVVQRMQLKLSWACNEKVLSLLHQHVTLIPYKIQVW